LGYSQVGKAAGFDPAIRRFESCYPSHIQRNRSIGRFFAEYALRLRSSVG
jgi:hypothetical protein